MDKMLSAVGVEDSSPSPGTNLPANKATATATPGGAPTQMHSLLSLVKQEQDIYNVIFHEIIRQVLGVMYSVKMSFRKIMVFSRVEANQSINTRSYYLDFNY